MNPFAFPRPATLWPSGQTFCKQEDGMTLRDYFAAKALPQIIADTGATGFEIRDNINSTADLIARNCYAIADAMLKARR